MTPNDYWPLISPSMVARFQAKGEWETIESQFEIAELEVDGDTKSIRSKRKALSESTHAADTIMEDIVNTTVYEYPLIKCPSTTVTISLFEKVAQSLIVHLQV